MRIIFGIFFSIIIFTSSFGQSKKELIIILKNQIDSLKEVVNKKSDTIISLNQDYSKLSKQLDKISSDYQKLTKNATQKEDSLNRLMLDIKKQNIKFMNYATHQNNEWIYLNRGETKNGFSFSENDRLFYHDKMIHGINIRQTTSSIKVSPITANRRYVICDTYGFFQDEYNLDGYFICDLLEHKSYGMLLGVYLGQTMLWSPEFTDVFLQGGGEGFSTLWHVQLSPFNIITFDLSSELKKDEYGSSIEEIWYDFNKFEWISKNRVKIVVDIHCNPYAGTENCNSENQNKIIRSYTYVYDIQKKEIVSKE